MPSRLHRHLPAGVADGLHAFGLQRKRQQAHGDLLAGGCDHVQFTHRRRVDGGSATPPWPAPASGWSRRSSRRERPPSDGLRAPMATRLARCACARSSPSTCRHTCERSAPCEEGEAELDGRAAPVRETLHFSCCAAARGHPSGWIRNPAQHASRTTRHCRDRPCIQPQAGDEQQPATVPY